MEKEKEMLEKATTDFIDIFQTNVKNIVNTIVENYDNKDLQKVAKKYGIDTSVLTSSSQKEAYKIDEIVSDMFYTDIVKLAKDIDKFKENNSL